MLCKLLIRCCSCTTVHWPPSAAVCHLLYILYRIGCMWHMLWQVSKRISDTWCISDHISYAIDDTCHTSHVNFTHVIRDTSDTILFKSHLCCSLIFFEIWDLLLSLLCYKVLCKEVLLFSFKNIIRLVARSSNMSFSVLFVHKI